MRSSAAPLARASFRCDSSRKPSKSAGELYASCRLGEQSRTVGRSTMRWFTTLLTVAAIAESLLATISPVQAQSCQQLWVERNSYYKAHGYCFKTQRAISYFGNGGCYIQDEGRVPLTPAERARIAQIERLERAYGCR